MSNNKKNLSFRIMRDKKTTNSLPSLGISIHKRPPNLGRKTLPSLATVYDKIIEKEEDEESLSENENDDNGLILNNNAGAENDDSYDQSDEELAELYVKSGIYVGNKNDQKKPHGKGALYKKVNAEGFFKTETSTFYDNESMVSTNNSETNSSLPKKVKLYEGDFVNGKFCGFGVYYFGDGNIRYKGFWENSKNNGNGINYFHDGSKEYEGEWKDNQSHGFGKQYYKNGKPKYVGNFKENSYDGIGIEYRKDGTLVYEGNWFDNSYNGEGSEYCKNGKTKLRSGIWKEGVQAEGNIYYKKDGNIKYKGKLVVCGDLNDREAYHYDEEGALYYKNGVIKYQGNFKTGNFHGNGQENHRNGNPRFIGVFYEGLLTDAGKEFHENGNLKYDGEFFNSLWNGRGKQYNEAGLIVREGSFLNGTFFDEQKAVLYHTDIPYTSGLKKYEGEIKDYKYNGLGIEYDTEGNMTYMGRFEDNKRNGKGEIFVYENDDCKNYQTTWEIGDLVDIEQEGIKINKPKLFDALWNGSIISFRELNEEKYTTDRIVIVHLMRKIVVFDGDYDEFTSKYNS